MTEEKYQELKGSMKCTYCFSYNNSGLTCTKTGEKRAMQAKPCKGFELSGMAAYFHGIETDADFQYFHERFIKEESNDVGD